MNLLIMDLLIKCILASVTVFLLVQLSQLVNLDLSYIILFYLALFFPIITYKG